MLPSWVITALVFITIPWVYWLANRPSADGVTFQPVAPIRFMYPVGLAMFLMLFIGFIIEIAHGNSNWSNWVCMLAMPVLWIGLLTSWPPTVKITEEGLQWHRLFIRKLIPWTAIEFVSLSTDQRVVIYCKDEKQYEVNTYVQGRPQLAGIIKQHLRKMNHGQK